MVRNGDQAEEARFQVCLFCMEWLPPMMRKGSGPKAERYSVNAVIHR